MGAILRYKLVVYTLAYGKRRGYFRKSTAIEMMPSFPWLFRGSHLLGKAVFGPFRVFSWPSFFRHSLRGSLLKGGYNNSLHVPLAAPTPAPTPLPLTPFFPL